MIPFWFFVGRPTSPFAAIAMLISVIVIPPLLIPFLDGMDDANRAQYISDFPNDSYWKPGTSIGARIAQHIPTYWLGYEIAKPNSR